MPKRIPVAVLSHRLLLGEALRLWLKETGLVSRVHLVTTGRELLATAGRIRIAFLDPGHPSEDVFGAARRLRRRKGAPALIFVADAAPVGWIRRALDVGASAYLGRCADVRAVTDAVRAVLCGQNYFTPCAARVVSQIASGSADVPALTAREIEVLQLICDGYSSKEIARKLGLAPKTIDSFRAALLEKTRARSSTRLVRFACDHRYVDPSPPTGAPDAPR